MSKHLFRTLRLAASLIVILAFVVAFPPVAVGILVGWMLLYICWVITEEDHSDPGYFGPLD